MKKGKLIVIDGADGSGKATQTELLVARLNYLGHATETIDFPRKDSFFGRLIYEGLDGKYGDFKSLHPKLASPLWAADRYLASDQMKKWLGEGKNIVADRYVSANQIHQGGKIRDEAERKEYMGWLDQLEHEEYKIPRPDLICLLDVPFSVSLKLMKERVEKEKVTHPLRRKSDQHESDPEHQIVARESAIKMLVDDSWVRIECSMDGETILPKDEIHLRILDHCLKIL